MAKTAILAIRIIADATKAAKGLQGASGEVSKFDKGMQRANKAALGVVTGLTAVGVASFNEANKLQQAAGAVDSVFGKQAAAVHKLAKSAADSFGMSRSEYSQTAAVFGAQLKNMGVSAGKLVPTTDKLIGLGSDLAATFGGSTSDAVAAIGSLMRGEADPIERYGVGIKQVDVNARLAAQGQDKLTGSAKKTAETEARLALLMEQTTAAQGQRAREANTAASRQEVAMAKLRNAGAALGTVLLPIVAAIAAQFAKLAGYVENNSTKFQIGAVIVGGFAAAVIATNLAVAAYRATVAAAAAVQWVLNAAMKANPIGLVIAAIMLLAAGFVLAYKRSETFRKIVQAVMKAARTAIGWVVTKSVELYNWIAARLPSALQRAKSVAVAAFRAYTTPIRAVVTIVSSLVSSFRERIPSAVSTAKSKAVTAWNAIKAPIETVANWVSTLISRIRSIKWPSPPKWLSSAGNVLSKLTGSYHGAAAVGGATSAYAPSVFAAPGELKAASSSLSVRRMGGRRDAGGLTIINVTGAIDPVSTARQIRRVLRRGDLAAGAPA